ncbi:hypothetical protein B0T19DRAFT_282319 [Cercophora scortea]|uniref:Amidoligase enzyme n=1 Tax=Cercophora scortea TaxID=314031 RepID=A0AAE0M5F9_9PEZI|nr:hypothetical protein B0T19DRAFT_282319 [Cercophora scortea]
MGEIWHTEDRAPLLPILRQRNSNLPHLSYGFELEMLMPTDNNRKPCPMLDRETGFQNNIPFADPHPWDGRWFLTGAGYYGSDANQRAIERKLVLALRAAGFPHVMQEILSDSDSDSDSVSGSKWTQAKYDTWVRKGLAPELPAALPRNQLIPLHYHYFIVKEEPTIEPDWFVREDALTGHYGWSGVEITSPVKYTPPERRENREEVTWLVRVLRNNLRVYIGRECGIHVHVGNSGRPFDVRVLKRLAVLNWCVGEAIFAMVAPWRYESGRVRTPAVLPGLIPSSPSTSADEVDRWYTKLIRYLTDVELEVLLPQRNFESTKRSFTTMRHTSKGTIEFRHLQGSLDPTLITAFSALAVGMVDLARLSSRSEFMWLVARLGGDRLANNHREVFRRLLIELGLQGTYGVWRQARAECENTGNRQWVMDNGAANLFVLPLP